MDRTPNLSKISYGLQYFLMILLVFMSTRTSPISQSLYVLMGVTLVVQVIFLARGFHFDKFTNHFLIFYVLIIAAYTLLFRSFNPIFSINLFLSIWLPYLVIRMVYLNFFTIFADLVYRLAVLSLVLFTIQQFAWEDLFKINNVLESQFSLMTFGGDEDSNSIIYTMKGIVPGRNSGFMWEPGSFAAMLAIAMMINLVINKFRVNFRLIILFIAMITTFSTMGYLVILVALGFLIYNVRISINFIYIPLAISVSIYFLNLDFMTDKLVKEYESIETTEDIAFSRQSLRHERVSLGRMASLKLDFEDFLKNPVLGVGGQFEEKTQSSYTLLNRTNGWGNYIVTFGLVGIYLFFRNNINTFRFYTKLYNIRGWLFMLSILLILSFSNGILSQPFFFGIQIFALIMIKYIPASALIK